MEHQRSWGRNIRDRITESSVKQSLRNGYMSKTRTREISIDMLMWKGANFLGGPF